MALLPHSPNPLNGDVGNSWSGITPTGRAALGYINPVTGASSTSWSGNNFNGLPPGTNYSGGTSYGNGSYGYSGNSNGVNNFGYQGTGASSGSYNPFNTLSNTKSPSFQSGINTTLGGINSQSYSPNVNPYNLRTNTKNPALDAATNSFIGNLGNYTNPRDFTKSQNLQSGVNTGYGQYNSDTSQNRSNYSDFVNLFNNQTPSVTGNVNQENNALSRTYNGGLQGDLANNAAQEAKAVNLSANRALMGVNRSASMGALSGGNSSYNTKQALDTASGIYANEALRQSELQRQNLEYMQGQQASLNGVRNQNLAGLATRQLQPMSVLTGLGNSEQQQLGTLGSIDNSNNIYTTPQERGAGTGQLLNTAAYANNNNNLYSLDSPQAFLGRQAGLLGQLDSTNNNNNFYGLSQPYAPNYSGYSSNSYSGLPQGGGNNYGLGFSGGGNYGNYGYPSYQSQGPANNGLSSSMQGPAYTYGTPQYYTAVNSLSNMSRPAPNDGANGTSYGGSGGAWAGGQYFGAYGANPYATSMTSR